MLISWEYIVAMVIGVLFSLFVVRGIKRFQRQAHEQKTKNSIDHENDQWSE